MLEAIYKLTNAFREIDKLTNNNFVSLSFSKITQKLKQNQLIHTKISSSCGTPYTLK